jgi:hypothetical protein
MINMGALFRATATESLRLNRTCLRAFVRVSALLFWLYKLYWGGADVSTPFQVLLGWINAFQGTPVPPKARVRARQDPLSIALLLSCRVYWGVVPDNAPLSLEVFPR